MRLLWQAFIAVLVVGTFVAIGIALVAPPYGGLGITDSYVGNSRVVTAVAPGSAAALAGLRAGDTISPATDPANVMRWATPRVGDRITLVKNGRDTITLTVQPVRPPLALALVVDTARIAFVLVAAIVAWRLAGDPAARALATFLACFGSGMRIGDSDWADPVMRFLSLITNEPLFVIGFGALAIFACRFPTPAASGWRTILARAVLPASVLGIALSIARNVLTTFFNDHLAVRPLLTAFVFILFGLVTASIAAMIASYRESTGAQKVRVLWTLRTFAVGFSGFIPMLVLVVLGFYTAQWIQYFNLTIVLIPIGLAYVILRHKMLDIGFVVNRAVVYSGVSIIVVGSFMVFEWIMGNVVQAQSRTSTFLQLGAALALGMSTRFIHARVDRFVDDLFFRERHLAEAAIRRFAHEAPLVTDADDLITKTVDVAQRNARLAGAAYYTRLDGVFVASNSTFAAAPDVSENDYAVLAMRTWHRPVELLEAQTSIPGDIAFPMMVRGELAGFLACGERTSHEALAPDERDALGQLARDSGIALDSLRVKALLGRAGLVAPA